MALRCGETDQKIYKCKKEIFSQRFGSNPKILRCLIPEDINSNQIVNCSANYIKAERNYFSSPIGIALAIL